jgi:eukaryotic-like serine/threonine-protein kinase
MVVETCQRCGTELRSDAPGGFCPRCLVQAGIDLSEGDHCGKGLERVPALCGGAPRQVAGAELPPSLVEGCRFGDYELIEQIGRGGMGVVYRAWQRSLDRVVAVKMMAFGSDSSPELIQRFRAEAVSAASLHHPNIVAIHEVGIHEGQHFFAMDYVEGQSLAWLVGNQSLPARCAVLYLKTVAEAVHYAHERGILHRDLKPSNVLIDAHDQPHVVDFGLARRLEGDSELTVTGQVLGSPHYLPPEQAAGQRGRISRRTDVYALGATLYHLLTGRPPFQAESLAQTLDLLLNTEPVAPRLLNPSVPVDLETVCLKCLEKEPGKRYATAQMLAEELGRYTDGKPVLARPVGRLAKAWRWCRRNPALAGTGAVAVLAVLLGFIGVLWQLQRVEFQRQRAEAGELLAGRRGYVSDMNLAQQALRANNPGRALELLNRHRPADASLVTHHAPRVTDLRGFEWRYLWQRCQTDAEAVGRLPSGIRSLEVSSDGRWLVAGSARGAVMVWNLSTGEKISLVPEPGPKACATFSPDSRLVLFDDQSTESFGTIGIWDLQTRQHLTPITDPWWVGPMAFSPDGKWLGYGVCSTNFQTKLVVLDFPTRKKVREVNTLTSIMSDHHGFGWVFTHDSRSVIFSENDPDRRIHVQSLAAGSEPQYFPGHREAITALAISPDGQILATGAGFTETDIKFWEVPSFRPLGELSGHERWIVGLKFSPDGQTLASGSADQTVRLWDVATRSSKWVSRRLPQEVWRVCFAPDGRRLFSGSSDGWIHRWSLGAPQTPSDVWSCQAELKPMTVAPDGKQFAGIRQGGVCVGEARDGALASPLPELGANNTCLLFSSDGQSLFAGTQAGEVQVWSIPLRRLLRTLPGSAEPVWRLRQDAQGCLLVVGQWKYDVKTGFPCRIRVWNVSDWQAPKSWIISGLGLAYAVSPDGRWLATGHGYGPVQLRNLSGRSGTNAVALAAGTTTDVAFSPDGRLLAASNQEGTVKVWEVSTLHELTPPDFRAHHRPVWTLTFSPDSRRLATAGDGEEALKLWDVATWEALITLERKGETLSQLAFSADGNQLAAGNSKGDVLFWRVPSLADIEAKEKKEKAQ